MSQSNTQYTRITLRIPQLLQTRAKQESEGQHVSLNSLIIRAIERAIAQKESKQ